MKRFTITITGQCPDDVPEDWIYRIAGNAEVQVNEPMVMLDGDEARALIDSGECGSYTDLPDSTPMCDVEFETKDVDTNVVIEDPERCRLCGAEFTDPSYGKGTKGRCQPCTLGEKYNAPMMVVVRDPDAPTSTYTFDGEVEDYVLDLGYMDLRDDDEFLEWACNHLTAAAEIKTTRREAAEFIEHAVLECRFKPNLYADWTIEQLLAAGREAGLI